jgi:hypothetical protein
MLAHEVEIGELPGGFGGKLVGGSSDAGADEILHLARKIAHQRLEDRFLAVEIDIEAARGDTGARGDLADRGIVKALFAEFLGRGIEQRAQVRRPRSVLGTLMGAGQTRSGSRGAGAIRVSAIDSRFLN